MNKLFVLTMVLVFALGMLSTVSAVVPQTASGLIGEGDDYVRVTLDLAGGWSAQFFPTAFYLYDKAFDENTTEFAAYGTVMTAEEYASLLEEYAEEPDAFVDRGGYVTHVTATGENAFYAPVSDSKYILLMVDAALNPDVVWNRVSYTVESYAAAEDDSQLISAVITDPDDKPVRVTVKAMDDISVDFYPKGFRLFCEGNEIAFGSVMSAGNFAAMKESYETPDEEMTATLEEKDGYYVLTDSDETISVGFYTPINEELYGMLHVEPNWGGYGIRELVSFAAVVSE